VAKYSLNNQGSFIIEDYNQARPFSNFFPGIAGLWGIPMWVFYVNRGQCIAGFGIESKDKAMMEFQPANKAYRLTASQGFRTFIKIKTNSSKTPVFWEPFQIHRQGTDFRTRQKLFITAHDLTIEEENLDLGLKIKVNYFTLPEEGYAALVRRVKIENTGKKTCSLQILDGLPAIVPFGLSDWVLKHMTRTAEAWIKVNNLKEKAPFYNLNVEISDKPQITHIQQGYFYFSFDPCTQKNNLFTPLVQSDTIFGASQDFIYPQEFFKSASFKIPLKQHTHNKTPSAMSFASFTLKPKFSQEMVSLFGYAIEQEKVKEIVRQATQKSFIADKARRNQEIIEGIKDHALTVSSSEPFNLYASQTFLDNILRGGLPISVKTKTGDVSFNVFSRKHGDLERDYNYFVTSPTFYSQGNGNYRDVNQNRRNDVWFNKNVQDTHVINFFNLIQADGYNPLIVKGTSFSVVDQQRLDSILKISVADEEERSHLREFLKHNFQPGMLFHLMASYDIKLNVHLKEFLGHILEICDKRELAEFGEGFWTDHWTYSLDLVESYLALYPEKLKELFLERKAFNFYYNLHYVLPRDLRYVLTDKGVRQYHCVAHGGGEAHLSDPSGRLHTNNGSGPVYWTNLLGKMLCLIANKAATLDPSGIGIEMEADKPNWYDALNGLPGLLGSSISETLELKRLCLFVKDTLNKLSLNDQEKISLFEELAVFINGLNHILHLEPEPYAYWVKSNDLKEEYRLKIRNGIDGAEKEINIGEIRKFLERLIEKLNKAIEFARDKEGFLATYFYHEVTEYELLEQKSKEGRPHVRPLKFKKHVLPLFLEGYVHRLRVEDNLKEAQKLYQEVRQSPLFDKKLKMYKVNADISSQSEDIGRTRVFPRGWLENESIWLHMEYKFMLELLRAGLYQEFYENFKNVFIPFLKPEQYGRSILENSSFIVSSAHEDSALHGQGFVARLSGSTAEFLHMWLWMNMGRNPFSIEKGKLQLTFNPILPGWLFTKKATQLQLCQADGSRQKLDLPANTYAFNLLGSILVVYHNPNRRDTFGDKKAIIEKIQLQYPSKPPVVVSSSLLSAPYAEDVRSHKVSRIDIFWK